MEMKPLRTMMIAAVAEPARVVSRVLTNVPMTSARRVSRMRGTSAKGIPNESATCERTSRGSVRAARTVCHASAPRVDVRSRHRGTLAIANC